MKWYSASSQLEDTERALAAAMGELDLALEGDSPDLLMVHATPHHLFEYGRIVPYLQDGLAPGVLVGCSAGGVVGGGQEIERCAGLTLCAAKLPGVHTKLLTATNADLPALDGSPTAWSDWIGVDPALDPNFVILGDPFSLNSEQLLAGLDYAYPRSTKIGGLASGANGPGVNALFANQETRRDGALILVLWGNLAVDTIVAQGCRPVGRPHRVTDCEAHILKSLDEETPVQVLQHIYDGMKPRDQKLARHSVFLGVVMSEMQEEVGHGDFLIRNIMGMDRETGVMAVGTELRAGQTVQFHVRDGETATADLTQRLKTYASSGHAAAGALLFSCMGRGRNLYGGDHHETKLLRDALGPVPLGGFFCNGEIGPVEDTTYLHGYTSAFGIFRPRD